MNTFARGKAPVLKARFRSSVGAIAISLDTDVEQTMFVSPAALEEAIGVELKVADIRMLAGGIVTYDHSHVVQGEEFTWTKQDNAEVFQCNRPEGLDIFNIIAINFPNDHSRDIYFQEHCVAKTTDDDYQLAKVMRAEKRAQRLAASNTSESTSSIATALIDTVKGVSKLSDLKAMVADYDEFESVREDVAKATSAAKARELMIGVLEKLPF